MKLFRFGAPGRSGRASCCPTARASTPPGSAATGTSAFFGGDGLDAPARVGSPPKARGRRAWRRAPALARRVARPSKLVCIGLNYRDHARESGAAAPRGADRVPEGDERAGRTQRRPRPARAAATRPTGRSSSASSSARAPSYVAVEGALAHVAGFVLHNDYSERGFQLERGGQWTKGKSADGFAPLGPWLVTADELPGFAAPRLWLKVNGQLKQQSNDRRHDLRRADAGQLRSRSS